MFVIIQITLNIKNFIYFIRSTLCFILIKLVSAAARDETASGVVLYTTSTRVPPGVRIREPDRGRAVASNRDGLGGSCHIVKWATHL